jgi:hypothetical protein
VRIGPHPHAVELLEYYARSLAVLDPARRELRDSAALATTAAR